MTSPIQLVVATWEDSEGRTADVVYDGDGLDAMTQMSPLRNLAIPSKETALRLHLLDGSVVELPFQGIAKLLPDRTGVIAIFDPGQYTLPDGSDVFAKPNNAAIFNADASLRFQLVLPSGDRIGAFHGGAMPDNFEGMLGLLIAPHKNSPPYLVYAFDFQSPVLIDTLQAIRW